MSPAISISSISPRQLPPSHSHHSIPKSSQHTLSHLQLPHIADASSSHRTSFYGNSDSSVNNVRVYEHRGADMIEEEQRSQVWGGESSPPDWYAMDISSPQSETPGGYHSNGQPMDIQTSPMVQEHPNRPPIDPDSMHHTHVITGHDAIAQSPSNKLGKFSSLGFGKKSSKWGLGGMFGHGDKGHTLPPVDEINAASSSSTPSLKRTQSSSTDSRSLSEMSPIQDVPVRHMDPKQIKKEAERVQREADIQRRTMKEKEQRDQARAVMEKRNKMNKMLAEPDDLAWKFHLAGNMANQRPDTRVKSKRGISPGPIRQNQGQGASGVGSTTVSAAAGRFDGPSAWRREERLPKARRREFDDDHSMSSSDVHSLGRMSAISFATVDSDPGPSVLRNRPSLFGINRMASRSSLRTGTSFDDFPSSARSSNSFSVGESLASDFRNRATMDGNGTISPPPMQYLSLSPGPNEKNRHLLPGIPQHPPDINSAGPYELGVLVRNHPPSPAFSAINPMFEVVSLESP